MKKLLVSLLLLMSFNLFAIVEHQVERAEVLFKPQQTFVWCWAATASGLYEFYNQDVKSQEEIAHHNPNIFLNGNPYPHVTMYFFPAKVLFPASHDYLVDDVLSNEKFQAYVRLFDEDFVKFKLQNKDPVALIYNQHVVTAYGYFNIGNEFFVKIYDPGAAYTFSSNFYYINIKQFSNVFKEPMAFMMFLEKKENQLAESIFIEKTFPL